MSAKRSDQDDTETPAPGCFVPAEQAKAEKEAAIAAEKSRSWNMIWGIIFKVANVLLITVVVPWVGISTNAIFEVRQLTKDVTDMQLQMRQVTAKQTQQDLTLADLSSWRNIGPRFTPTDAENLRLRILNEVQQQISVTVTDISTKLTQIQRDVLETQVMFRAHVATHEGLNGKPRS